MISTVQKPFSEYASRLVDLHALIRVGTDETTEGEVLRDEMDRWWRRMSQEEIEQAGQLSEDLYFVHESAAGAKVEFKDDIWKQLQSQMSNENWGDAINVIRRHKMEIPAFVIAFFEGL